MMSKTKYHPTNPEKPNSLNPTEQTVLAIYLPTCNLSCNSLLCKVREATLACSRTRRSCWSASELISNKLSAPWKRDRQFKIIF